MLKFWCFFKLYYYYFLFFFKINIYATCFVFLNMAAKPSHSDRSLKVKYEEIDWLIKKSFNTKQLLLLLFFLIYFFFLVVFFQPPGTWYFLPYANWEPETIFKAKCTKKVQRPIVWLSPQFDLFFLSPWMFELQRVKCNHKMKNLWN